MDTVRGLLVDAFTTDPYSGNPAGVVPSADGLDDAQMQAIANELGASETAFVSDAADAEIRLRYFTPSTEVDLCGHATIASLHLLAEDGRFAPGEHTIETNVGVLDVRVSDDDVVWMTQSAPTVEPVEYEVARVSDALGVPGAAIDEVADDLPIAVASTGLPFLVVPIAFLEPLGDAIPDFDAIEELADDFGAAGVYPFTFDTLDADATLHGRAFVPGAGVLEDPVTGTASGAAGAYLDHVGALDGGGTAPGSSDVHVDASAPDEMVFEQGAFVDRPGRVHVRVDESVQVGGAAVTVFDGTLAVPPAGDDDIVEV
ncbi:MAG: PhzF family phenazine biosynthesis protein [Halanaeroarchaeum sp.]